MIGKERAEPRLIQFCAVTKLDPISANNQAPTSRMSGFNQANELALQGGDTSVHLQQPGGRKVAGVVKRECSTCVCDESCLCEACYGLETVRSLARCVGVRAAGGGCRGIGELVGRGSRRRYL